MPRGRTVQGVSGGVAPVVNEFFLVTKPTYVDEDVPAATFGLTSPQLRKTEPDDSAEKVMLFEFDSSQASIRSIIVPANNIRLCDGGAALSSGDVSAIDMRCQLIKTAFSAAAISYTTWSGLTIENFDGWTDTLEDETIAPIDQAPDADEFAAFLGADICFHRSSGAAVTGPYFGFAILIPSISGLLTPMEVTQTVDSLVAGNEPRILTS